jgi:tetratricopeptide (TPR) repeat protein
MKAGTVRRNAATRAALALLFAASALLSGCGRGAQGNANGAGALQGASPPSATPSATPGAEAAAAEDAAKLDSDIERLEKQAERNPADEDTRDDLARAYVRRGNAQRAASKWQEALSDYQSALRLDPDNTEAQAGAAASKEQLGGEQEDENGAPAPLPITPNVADEGEGPTPKPKPTPKKQ